MIRLDVLGTPAPKGSGRAMLIKGRARFIAGGTSQNAKAMLTFESAIREQVHAHVFGGQRPKEYAPVYPIEPVSVGIVFRLKRPQSHYGTGKNAAVLKPGLENFPPITKPDLDKLARHVIDVLTGSVWHDDSQVAELSTRKVYAQPGNEGALIIVDAWRPT